MATLVHSLPSVRGSTVASCDSSKGRQLSARSSSFSSRSVQLSAIFPNRSTLSSRQTVTVESGLRDMITGNQNDSGAEKKAVKKKKVVKKKAPAPEPETKKILFESDDSNYVAEVADELKVKWKAFDTSTGRQVDVSISQYPKGICEFQIGTDAGYQSKNGLRLAFNYACMGYRVGDVVSVYARPTGGGFGGLFKSYGVYDDEGTRVSELTFDEKKTCMWFDEPETRLDVEILAIQRPRGRRERPKKSRFAEKGEVNYFNQRD